MEAPLVFIGYGLNASEEGYDDFAGVDLQGKIGVYLSGAGPSSVPGNMRAHFGSWLATIAMSAIAVPLEVPASLCITLVPPQHYSQFLVGGEVIRIGFHLLPKRRCCAFLVSTSQQHQAIVGINVREFGIQLNGPFQC